MEIEYGYGGSSISIVNEDRNGTTSIVSPVKEKNKYSNYYNFRVRNKNAQEGTVIIKNLTEQEYDSILNPLTIDKDGNYRRLSKEECLLIDGDLHIVVKPNTKMEITSYPRYTIETLKSYMSGLKDEHVSVNRSGLYEIVIGDKSKPAIFIIGRQHPGETLSSFFIEGMINSILDNKLYENYCFVIYPIVNQKGVLNGNHRYVNDTQDYNRLWHTTGVIPEIDRIKSQMDKNNIVDFIDVHCDEITKNDYIRTKITDLKDKIDGIQVLEDQSNFKRFARALVKQRKIINVFDKKAREYVEQTYKCNSMLIELSLHNCDTIQRTKLGYNFISKYMGVEMNEDYTNTRKK